MAEMKSERVRGDAVSSYKSVLKRILDIAIDQDIHAIHFRPVHHQPAAKEV